MYSAPPPLLPLPTPPPPRRGLPDFDRFISKPSRVASTAFDDRDIVRRLVARLDVKHVHWPCWGVSGTLSSSFGRRWPYRSTTKVSVLWRLRRWGIEQAFEAFAGLPKVADDTLFGALALFDQYYRLKRPIVTSKSVVAQRRAVKEVIAAAIVLCSKADNVRHLSVRAAMEAIGLAETARDAIVEKEMKLFLAFNHVITVPTVSCFVRAILGKLHDLHSSCSSAIIATTIPLCPSCVACGTSDIAYHLAVYVFALNLLSTDCIAQCRPDTVAETCVRSALSLLRPLDSTAPTTRNYVGPRGGSNISGDPTRLRGSCQQLMDRAFEACLELDNPVNIHFSTPERCRVRDIVVSAAATNCTSWKPMTSSSFPRWSRHAPA